MALRHILPNNKHLINSSLTNNLNSQKTANKQGKLFGILFSAIRKNGFVCVSVAESDEFGLEFIGEWEKNA